jgi:K+/H+ antiporter YhaU regulatory subunit KhtT
MIRVHVNKDTSVHGTYKSKDITLKLLMQNKTSLGALLNERIDAFQEGDEGSFVFSFDHREPCTTLRLDKDATGECVVSLTKKMSVTKEHMSQIESMIHQMADACTLEHCAPPSPASSTQLLKTDSVSPRMGVVHD